MTNCPESIIILGSSIEAWMSATFFAKLYASTGIKITVVTSDNPPINLGVCSVHPTFREFLNFMELDESIFVKHTQAWFKLTDFYNDWNSNKSSFFHSFGVYGANKDAATFCDLYLRSIKENILVNFDQFSFNVEAAKSNLFSHPVKDQNSILSSIKYSWHFQTKDFTELLIEYCLSQKVCIINGEAKITINPNKPNLIESITVEQTKKLYRLTADLYVNCNPDIYNENGEKIQKHENTIDWQSEILINTAIRTAQKGKLKNNLCDIISALPYGYELIKPSRENIEATLFSNTKVITKEYEYDFLKRHNNPTFEKQNFSSYRLKSFWQGNLISIGPSGICLPTHCISGLDLTWQALKYLIKFTPDKTPNQFIQNEYNQLLGKTYDNIKDFVRLQFLTCTHTSSTFWRLLKTAKISEDLKYKMELFKQRGKLPEYESELFDTDFQTAFLLGTGYLPKFVDPLAMTLSSDEIIHHLKLIKDKISEGLAKLPKHDEYLFGYIKHAQIRSL